MRKIFHMEREIAESPKVLRRFFATQSRALFAFAKDARLRSPRLVVLVARGTSDNAATYARYLIEREWGVPVSLAAPSLLTLYRASVDFRDALVVGISQSGEGPDTCRVVEEARRQGALTLAVTNFPKSRLARAAAHSLALSAGWERSVAATKTFTAELAALAAMASVVRAGEEAKRLFPKWRALVEEGVRLSRSVRDLAPRFLHLSFCAVVGRGFHYGLAQEAALKLKECAQVMAHAYSTADFHHGPKALAGRGFSVIVLAPSGPTLSGSLKLLRELRARGVDLTVLSSEPAALKLASNPVRTPDGAEEWNPLGVAPILQTLAFEVAKVKGLDPDRPPHLRKVTRTR